MLRLPIPASEDGINAREVNKYFKLESVRSHLIEVDEGSHATSSEYLTVSICTPGGREPFYIFTHLIFCEQGRLWDITDPQPFAILCWLSGTKWSAKGYSLTLRLK